MAKPTRRFNYVERDPKLAKERANRRSGDFDSIYKEGVKIFKPREGKNTIRILPPSWDSAAHYGYDTHVNYSIGIDDQAYLSLSAMKNEPDPLAEARKQAEKQGNKKLADSLRPSHRIAFYLIDRMAEEEGVQLWAAPFGVDKSFLNIAIDEDSGEIMMVDHPDDGNDIRFYKEGTGLTTKYPADKMRVLKASPLHEDPKQADEWLDFATNNPIPDMLNFYSYEHIASVFEGQAAKVEEADEKPAKGKSNPLPDDDDEPVKPRTRSRPKVDDDEDVDDDGVVTSKKNGKTAKVSEPDEDDDAEASKMSASSIRQRLQGRRAQPTTDDDD